MDAIEMIKGRRSVRKFTDKKVSHTIIKDAIEISSYSPSWANTQTSRYNIIDDPEKKAAFAKAAIAGLEWNINIINNAAGIIVMSYVKGLSGYKNGNLLTKKGDSWAMYDSGIAAQTLSLALYEKGIGSVILGVFDEDIAGEFLQLPDNEVVAVIIPYGYAAAPSNMPPRKSIDEIVRFM